MFHSNYVNTFKIQTKMALIIIRYEYSISKLFSPYKVHAITSSYKKKSRFCHLGSTNCPSYGHINLVLSGVSSLIMRKQGNYFPTSQCCCRCNSQPSDFPQEIKNNEYREGFNTFRDEYDRYDRERRPSFDPTYCRDEQIDEETRQTFTSMRQKACRFIAEETECSSGSDSDGGQCMCEQGNSEREGSILKKMQGSIDYAPQSEFLKKIKRQLQCQCLSNSEQRENLSNSNEFIPRICEECIAKSNEIIRLLEQLNNHSLAATNEYNDQCKACQCCEEEGEPDRNGIKRIVKTCRSVVDGLKNVLTSMGPYMNGECFNENYLDENVDQLQKVKSNGFIQESRREKCQNGKSQHVSRSKKRVKCRERRKRKSNESEKCLSQDRFEPSLKKPHENSCERCWRYASPSRSPVNKPAQRFDPNFRRSHSCQDFQSAEASQNESGRPRNGTCEWNQSFANKNTAYSPRNRSQGSDCGSTRVKELMLENSIFLSPQSRHQKEGFCNEGRATFQEASDRGPRPKSSLGVSPHLNSLDTTEYKEIKPRRPCISEDAGSKPLRSNANPKLLKSSDKINTNHEKVKREAQRQCSPNFGKRNKTVSNSMVANKPSRKAPDSASSNPTQCRKCTCNENQPMRSDSSKNSPQHSLKNRSPKRDSPISPIRTQSFALVENQFRRPQTGDYDAPTSSHVRPQNRSSRVEKSNYEPAKQTRENKFCTCQGQPTRPASAVSEPKCCHGHSKRNSPRQMNHFNWNPSTNEMPQTQPYMTQNYNSCNETDARYGGQHYASSNRQDNSGNDNLQNHPGKPVPCPYQPNRSDNNEYYNSGRSYQDNQGWCSRANETYPPAGRRNCPPRDNNAKSNGFNVPKKYCVFYMTKGKSDKGNEVEVLVEELTEKCKANNKDMTALKEKMKKLDDCPSESMALRFQKGVNESSKSLLPETGRILYF